MKHWRHCVLCEHNISSALFIFVMSAMQQSQVHVPPFCICMASLSPHSVFIYLGFGGYAVVVNAGMHRASIACKKQGCPRIIETWDVDAKGRL